MPFSIIISTWATGSLLVLGVIPGHSSIAQYSEGRVSRLWSNIAAIIQWIFIQVLLIQLLVLSHTYYPMVVMLFIESCIHSSSSQVYKNFAKWELAWYYPGFNAILNVLPSACAMIETETGSVLIVHVYPPSEAAVMYIMRRYMYHADICMHVHYWYYVGIHEHT